MDKPLLRGKLHQVAFFFALGASAMLLQKANGLRQVFAMLIYSLSLTSMFGVSALYHRHHWGDRMRMWMRRLDHSAIFILIAGTGTPICMLGISDSSGTKLLTILWIAAAVGVLQSLFWVHAPKWVTAILYITMGWQAFPYLGEFVMALGSSGAMLLLAGGVIYTLGAIVYALKRPNPNPKIFGYHEIFHLLVTVAAALHFVVILNLVR